MKDMHNLIVLALCTVQLLADIQGTSAITGDGLYDGLDWLKDTLTAKAKHS